VSVRLNPVGAACLVILLLGASGQSTGQDSASLSIPALLDRYHAGEFATAAQLAAATDPTQIQSLFIPAAEAWIAHDSSDIINRRLVATAFAIEIAQARLAYDSPTLMVLLDWARKEWHKGPASAVEHTWTRAAAVLVERGGRRLTVGAGGLDSQDKGSAFLDAAVKRFPDDARLQLAVLGSPLGEGLPGALAVKPLNVASLERLTKDAEVGPDALIEFAYLKISEREPEAARRLAQQAGSQSAETWIRYLSHFIVAVSHEFQGHYQDAVREYSAALNAVPHAQSASIALAQLLLRDNQGKPAMDLLNRSLTERPDGDDPWRLFAYGGYIRWPTLIADVRKAIR
jgi:hypothetical protein